MQDIHTYPDDTSIGTFSGVWPRYARFWTHGDAPATDQGRPDVGRELWRGFLVWLESLATDDPLAFQGMRAVSPMNETVHLAGLYNGADPVRTDRAMFLPPLPTPRAAAYLADLNDDGGGARAEAGAAAAPRGRACTARRWRGSAGRACGWRRRSPRRAPITRCGTRATT